MRQVYVESGAMVALLRPGHRAHKRMLGHFERLLDLRDLLVTTDIAVAEAATALRRDPGLYRAVAFRDALAQSVRGGGIRIVDSDDQLRQRAFAVMAANPDVTLTYRRLRGGGDGQQQTRRGDRRGRIGVARPGLPARAG